MRRIEQHGMMACVLLSAGKVYLIPQTSKTVGRRFTYPSIFDAFKDLPARPEGLRPRFVGTIEMAGIFLCYSRGDVSAMRQMYDVMDLETYRHMLLETGLPWSSDAARRLADGCRATCSERLEMISTLSPDASDSEVVGGKVAGVNALHELCHQWCSPALDRGTTCASLPDLLVPEGLVIPTSSFEQIVLDSPLVQAHLKALSELLKRCSPSDSPLDPCLSKRVAEISQALRDAVAEIRIPDKLADSLHHAMHALGGHLAVRSSASLEDQAASSGAGLARTVLDVHTLEALHVAVRSVWASLYSDGFIQLCRRTGQDIAEARMAVLLQPMIHPRVAGVVTSLDARGRPVFSISACGGLGVQMVDGGPADAWLVSPHAGYILENHCRKAGHPCMRDSEVLSLAGVSRRVQRAWQSSGSAEQVDIEFAIDNGGRIVLLQCRPLTAVGQDESAHLDVVECEQGPPQARQCRSQVFVRLRGWPSDG